MAIVEMDSMFVRAIRYLHSTSSDSQINLHALVEDAIKNKYGATKELSTTLNISAVFQEYPVITSLTTVISTDAVISTDIIKEESRTASSSDNELELDLLKEDLMCIICKGMGVGARNRLLECFDCHSLYHQECHDPPVLQEEIESNPTWNCGSCKKQQLKLSKSRAYPTEKVKPLKSPAPQSPITIKGYSDKETGSSSKVPKVSSGNSSKQSMQHSSRMLTPNINIISADKRLQIMKKKAAKLQEKRKLNNR